MFFLESYTIAAEWFPRLLGLIYFFTFGAFALQIKGLLGENGILPITSFLRHIKRYYPNRCYRTIPTLFWISSSNNTLMGVTLAGMLFSLLLFFGFFPPLALLLLYVLYLSIVSVGQEFLGFGWEGFILEITANAFLLSFTVVPNPVVWMSLNVLLFRFHIQAGAVKLQSRDPNWRNQSAIAYHYQTQPLPNTIAWHIYRFPLRFHQISCIAMFFIELAIPFAIFFGENMRLTAFTGLFALQYFIWLTGNLSFLNHLTAVFCVILLNNATLEMVGLAAPPIDVAPLWLEIVLSTTASLLLALQVIRLYTHFFHIPSFGRVLHAVAPFHIANRYGIFAVMTTKRYEIIIEGSDDGIEWKEYTFRHKPSEVTRRPHRVSPYQPRIDWQAWFLPFSSFDKERWFQEFLYHILKGTDDVLKLLKHNPFEGRPPKFLRAIAYDYVFSTPEERSAHGLWWRRTYVGAYSPVLSLTTSNNTHL